MASAIVVGNGESRCDVDLTLFQDYHTLIGCNAIHRDVIVDHLVCCDHKMVREALKNPDTKQTEIYVRINWYHYFRKILKNKNIKLLPIIPYHGVDRADKPENWGSGPYALLVSATMGFDQINLLGFDLYGINGKVNNIYKNTENYAVDSKRAVDHSYWVYQISKIFELFPDITFSVYNRDSWVMPERWIKHNVKKINIDLVNQLNNSYNNT